MPTKLRRKTSPIIKKIFEYKFLILAFAIIAIGFYTFPKISQTFSNIFQVPKIITSVLLNKEIELQKEEGAINILLLGIGGGTHDGPKLTDTIIFAHIDPEKNKVVLISLPRDLWVPVLNSKINAAYEFGDKKKAGGGLTLAKATVSDILNQQVNYAFLIDFSGFVKIVNQLGGLTIDVDRTFDDFNYLPPKQSSTVGISPVVVVLRMQSE